MADKIQSMITSPTPGQQTGEEILGALGMLGGSYLGSRPGGRLQAFGAPLTLAGSGLFGAGYEGGQARDDKAQQAAGLKAFEGRTPGEPKAMVADALLKAGVPIGQVKDYTSLLPDEKDKTKYEHTMIGGQEYTFDPAKGTFAKAPIAAVPPKPVETDAQKLALHTKERQIDQQYPIRAPERPREQVLTDDKGHAVIVDLDTGASRPLGNLFKTAPKGAAPKLIKAGDTLMAVSFDADGNPVSKKVMDIPPSVKNKSEFTTFADGYVTDHPDAKGPEIVKAYSDAKRAPATVSSKEKDIADWMGRNPSKTREDAEEALAKGLATARAVVPHPKATTPAQAMANVKAAQAIVASRMGKPGGGFLGFGGGPGARAFDAAVAAQLLALGLDPRGMPLKKGHTITVP